LYLLVNPSGGKLWRMKYRFEGKEKLLSFGTYPTIGLKEARERRDEARKLLANGADPSAARKAQRVAGLEQASSTFEAVAGRWFEKWRTEVTDSTAKSQWARLEKHIMPALGTKPVSEIGTADVIAVLKPLEARGTGDTLRKAKMAIGLIMRFAKQHNLVKSNPVPDTRGAFKTFSVKHMPAVLDQVKLGQLLRDIDRYTGQPSVCAALRLLPLLFSRPGELRMAKWADIDLEQGEWRYTASKTRRDHVVPLSRQAVAILQDLYPITGHDKSGFVFPGLTPGKPISDISLNSALRRIGVDTKTEQTSHGWRAVARTLLAEELEYDPVLIEHQLAHRIPGEELGYIRTKYLKQRKEMMQSWADHMDRLKIGADVIPLRA
jgi:integrase